MNNFTVEAYEKILESIIDRALRKLDPHGDWYKNNLGKNFFDMPYDKRMENLKQYMTTMEYKFVINACEKDKEIERHVMWLTS